MNTQHRIDLDSTGLDRALRNAQRALNHVQTAIQQLREVPADTAVACGAVSLDAADVALTHAVRALWEKSKVEDAARRERSTQMVSATRRRFGPFPGSQPEGILTAKASYDAGYETGRRWTENYTPGGPYWQRASTYPGPTAAAHPDEYRAYCEATEENHREWMRGWHDGKAERDRTP